MPCAHCGSDLECLYVVEWLGGSDKMIDGSDRRIGGSDRRIGGSDDGGLDALAVSDVPRAPGAMLVAIPFSQTTVAVADIPLRPGVDFEVDPVIWNTTLLSMSTRRRDRRPCLAYEDGPVFDWISRGVFDALGRLDKGSRLPSDEEIDDRITAESECDDGRLTAHHAYYARLRIKIQYAAHVSKALDRRQRLVETSTYH